MYCLRTRFAWLAFDVWLEISLTAFCDFEQRLGLGMTIISAWRQKIEEFLISKAFKAQTATCSLDKFTMKYTKGVTVDIQGNITLSSSSVTVVFDVNHLTSGPLGFLFFGSFVHSSLLFNTGLLLRMLKASVACRSAGSPGNFPRISNFRCGTSPLWHSHTWS